MKNLAITQGAAMLKVLGNQKRLEILYHLSGKELNVGELEKWLISASRHYRSIWRFCGTTELLKPAVRHRQFSIQSAVKRRLS